MVIQFAFLYKIQICYLLSFTHVVEGSFKWYWSFCTSAALLSVASSGAHIVSAYRDRHLFRLAANLESTTACSANVQSFATFTEILTHAFVLVCNRLLTLMKCRKSFVEEEEEEIYLTQIRNNHGNSTPIVQSQVARKPEGQQCRPPIEHTNC